MAQKYRVRLLLQDSICNLRLYSLHLGTALQLENEFCDLRPILHPIDQPSYRYFPYIVTLYRCGGSDGYISLRYRTCTPATSEKVRISVRNLERGGFSEITVTNHISCKSGCTNEKEMCDTEMEAWNDMLCICECKYPNGPPQACPAQFK